MADPKKTDDRREEAGREDERPEGHLSPQIDEGEAEPDPDLQIAQRQEQASGYGGQS